MAKVILNAKLDILPNVTHYVFCLSATTGARTT
jgi:hypothetical protein